ncbi:MAG: hypothetical protein ACRDIX_01090 [Actinomycetota bacterium]
MTTTDSVKEKALALAEAGSPTDEAVRELLASCKEKRVPVVLARQQFLQQQEEHPDNLVFNRAVELLDNVLARLPPD